MTADPFLVEMEHALGPERCLQDEALLLAYECDGLTHFRQRPRAVLFPESAAEVQRIVRAARAHRVPFTPRGAGTGLSGGAVAAPGGVVLEFARMNRILRIDPEDRLAVVEPGVVNARLSEAARPFGLAYAPDPSSQGVCTLGGNVAENSGGPHCLKSGATTNHVLALEVVLPDGELVTLGSPRAFSAGPDLRGLILGSEGTLGIVTAITCRLVPRVPAIETLLASFASLDAACRAVSAIIAAGILPAALEALDERTIRAVEAGNLQAGYPKDAAAVLLIELDGHAAAVDAEREQVAGILEAEGALVVESARDPAERARLWKGRKGAFGAMGRLAPDLYVQDAVVPRSQLPVVLPRICAICDELGLPLANVFHAGEGNLHPNISYDGRDPDQVARVVEAGRRILEVCIQAGGALSGEHGIGLEKLEFMPLLFSDDDLLAMRAVRVAFDPDGLLNPGKILPTPGACAEIRAARPRPR
jgi:glycolate oxidase subunit GlcD